VKRKAVNKKTSAKSVKTRVAAQPAAKSTAKSAGKPTGKSAGKPAVRIKRSAETASFERLLKTGGTPIENYKSLRFAGISLAGGKTDKTAIAVLEYYPDRKRVFLRSLKDKVGSGEELADVQLLNFLNLEEAGLTSIAFDAALQLPKCIRCVVQCPGYQNCKETEIKWMWQMHRKRDRLKRPNKMFTPYTERCAEIYIANELEEPFHPSHALGSNGAPLTARAVYLRRLLSAPVLEAYPKLTLWRIGLSLNIPKSYLRFHRHAVDSDEARHYILKTLIEKEIAFIYQQDLKVMVENSQAFDAFMTALTAFLKHRGQTEKPPADYPKTEAWIDFPRQTIQWF
jgi:hypothetical protein